MLRSLGSLGSLLVLVLHLLELRRGRDRWRRQHCHRLLLPRLLVLRLLVLCGGLLLVQVLLLEL